MQYFMNKNKNFLLCLFAENRNFTEKIEETLAQ